MAGKTNTAASIDQKEIDNFAAMAETWWDPKGPFKPLHNLNPARLSYIRSVLDDHFGLGGKKDKPLKGLKVLDIGCGGGLLAEPMSRLGAEVTGIDAAEKNIKIASLHAKESKLKIDYRAIAGEDLAKTRARFDVILNMEVLEHVADVGSFIGACSKLLKKEGCMLFSTINRTPKSYLFAIVGAEHVLHWLPKGTHTYEKFLKPSELDAVFKKAGLRLGDLKGFIYNPLGGGWSLGDDLSVNYIGKVVPA
ncbi:MAG: bifunctional 2-polyprenyl-6-hydroxyphenol methylase/3-demethylubiquinol 3-O-methyltransferase UbiG [Alphaproteobacteria bacterium]